MNKSNIKEFIRHSITLLHLSFFFNLYRRVSGKKYNHLFIKGRQNRFTKIYETKVWLEGKSEGSLSGVGSNLENTENIRQQLPEVLLQLNAKKLLDIGCGDWTWMQHIKLPCDYIGVDIVTSVIEQNIAQFTRPNVTFQELDAVASPLPESDVVLCREVIFHLSFDDTKKLLNNLTSTNAEYFITTSDSDVSINADIQTGDFRNLNLRIKPFHFPAPIASILDNSISKGRKIEVWKVSDLPKY
jgi:SAM-dependent methyltransferase